MLSAVRKILYVKLVKNNPIAIKLDTYSSVLRDLHRNGHDFDLSRRFIRKYSEPPRSRKLENSVSS